MRVYVLLPKYSPRKTNDIKATLLKHFCRQGNPCAEHAISTLPSICSHDISYNFQKLWRSENTELRAEYNDPRGVLWRLVDAQSKHFCHKTLLGHLIRHYLCIYFSWKLSTLNFGVTKEVHAQLWDYMDFFSIKLCSLLKKSVFSKISAIKIWSSCG